MQYIGSNIRFIFTKIKELLNSHNTNSSAHSKLFKSWTLLRNPTNAAIADALAVTHKNGIGDVLVEVANTQTFALEDMKLFFRPARFQQTSATESRYEGIYITMDGTQGRYVAKTFADSEIMTPEGPSTISTPSELVLYPASSDAVLYTPQTLTEEQQAQARTNIGVGQPVFAVNVTSTLDDQVGKVYTADKTAAEIEAAYQAGHTIVCKTQADFWIGYIPAELPLVSRNQERVFFFAVDQLMRDNTILTITVNISDSGVEANTMEVGIYEKPASGIPKSDLADDVQKSLTGADQAVEQINRMHFIQMEENNGELLAENKTTAAETHTLIMDKINSGYTVALMYQGIPYLLSGVTIMGNNQLPTFSAISSSVDIKLLQIRYRPAGNVFKYILSTKEIIEDAVKCKVVGRRLIFTAGAVVSGNVAVIG